MQATIIIIKKLQNTRLAQYIWLVDFSLFLTWMLITDSFSLSLQQATQGFTTSTHFFIKTIKAWAKVDGYMDQKGAVFQTIGIIFFPFGQNTKVTFL